MPRGIGDIPDLRLDVIQNFVTMFTAAPELVLMNLFPASNSPSSSIKWESHRGGRGMTPFVPPGAPAPQTAPYGIAQHSAEAAYWKEKSYYDEEFLNNLRREGTETEYLDSQTRLARDLAGLVNRSNRRKEWMFAKMLFAGSFTYSVTSGVKISVDYSIPTTHNVALATAYKWQAGSSRNILKDIIDGKRVVSDDCGGIVDYAIMNSQVLEYAAADPTIQTLLQKSAFGQGNLFDGNVNQIVGANPNIIGSLLNIKNFLVYDEQYEVRAYLTAAVTGGSTTAVSVDDTSDFEAGGTLRFHDVSAGTYEDETIASVGVEASTVTVSTAPTASFKAGEDYVTMTKKFIPDDKFVMFASRVDNAPVAEYKRAPFGLGRRYGMFTDRHEEWDPEGIWIRSQDKGLPVLYQRDAVYILDVN
jgi:hypothetical protein